MNALLRLALAVAVLAGGPLLSVGCGSSEGSPNEDGGSTLADSEAGGSLLADGGIGNDAVAPTIQGCPVTRSVDVSTVGEPLGTFREVPACDVGYARPNVCCRGSPTQATVCADCPDVPFGACDKESLTFPDPRTCCSLEGGGCTATAPSDAGATGDCFYPCGPGGYSPDELGDAAALPACSDVVDGGAPPVCAYCCLGSVGPGCATNGCSGGLGACGPHCGTCPAGWNVPRGGIDLCCRTDNAGVAECFSQATGIGTILGPAGPGL
jgi:hypothetical protein